MKKLILATLATLIASPALAVSLSCSVTDARGRNTTYGFDSWVGNEIQEIAVTKNGATLRHAPDARPLWTVRNSGSVLSLNYQPDPRFSLMMESNGPTYSRDGFDFAPAYLFNGGTRIASGVCGMLSGQRSRGTTGGRPVQRF